MLQCVAETYEHAGEKRDTVVCCNVLQCVAVCCSVLQCVAETYEHAGEMRDTVVCCNVSQCVAVCCSVLQCVAVTYEHAGEMRDTKQETRERDQRLETERRVRHDRDTINRISDADIRTTHCNNTLQHTSAAANF